MSSSSPVHFTAPGPFRAEQLRPGDPYELSNGHPIQCAPAGERHGSANLDGGRVLATDPAAQDAGIDVGITWNDGKNLRAPDIAVGPFQRKPGWSDVVPPLIVEYADTSQDEGELQQKITELLGRGVRFIWVVRLVGPLRVEVYEPGKPLQRVDGDGELLAPGVLQNPVPVRALVDPQAANEATLRNLLNRKGYSSLEAVRQQGELAGLQQALVTTLQARGLVLDASGKALIQVCADRALLNLWLARAVTASTQDALFGSP